MGGKKIALFMKFIKQNSANAALFYFDITENANVHPGLSFFVWCWLAGMPAQIFLHFKM